MSYQTPIKVRVLHAVRTMGYVDDARVADRLSVPETEVTEHLLDAQARGWVVHSAFAGDSGWSLTESGRTHGERMLAEELDTTGFRRAVEEAYQEFLPLNGLVARACTTWQLTQLGVGAQAVSLAETIASLRAPAAALAQLEHDLSSGLPRFSGYDERFSSALEAAHDEPEWITGTDRDSCHRVWFELHEDFIATLGISR
jgi:hypothetical protein